MRTISSTELEEAGGPAFPGAIPANFHEAWPGMSIRDYFAGQALIGLIDRSQGAISDFARDNARLAEIAFIVADAMLDAREKSVA